MAIQSFTTETGYSVQSLDLNVQAMSLAGYAVVSGCAVSLNTGTLGAGNSALQVAAGSVRHNATDVTVAGQNVDVEKGGNQPRKDVVFIDSNGDAQVRKGKPTEPDPSNAKRTTAESPSPDSFSDYGGVVLAEIWVGKSATTLTSDDILDRRVAAIGDGHTHAHSDLTGIGASDHHARYTDTEAVDAVEAHASALTIDITGEAQTTQSNLDTHAGDAAAHHTRYTDTEAVGAVEAHPDALTIDITGVAEGTTASDVGAVPATGGVFTGAVNLGSATDGDVALVSGGNPATVITETTAPKGFGFTGSDTIDTHVQTDVTISNSSGASATEDITVDLYDGVDNTGTLLLTETQSITVADASSTTATFIVDEKPLDAGDYYIEVTQSGTALSIDQTDEYTRGAEYTLDQTPTGVLQLVTQDGDVVYAVSPRSGGIEVNQELIVTSMRTREVPNGATFVDIEGGNNDVDVWRVGNNGDYGYSMRYIGSGSGDDNDLSLFTDDVANAGENQVFAIKQSGNIDFKQVLSANGSRVSVTPDGNAVEFYVSSTAPSTSNPYVRFEP